MPVVQPPNEQTLRPQTLTQVGHEGNPVEFSIAITGTLDGNPTLIPPILPGVGGATPLLPLSASGGGGNCYQGVCATIAITGGTKPYSVSTDVGTFTMNEAGTGGTICEGSNPGSGESPATVAYGKVSSWCCTFTACGCKSWNCAGALIEDCTFSGCEAMASEAGLSCACGSCSGCNLNCCIGGAVGCSPVSICDQACCNQTRAGSGCECVESVGVEVDMRDNNGLSSDCKPCAMQFHNGATVTITDANGSTLIFSVDWDTDE